MMCLLFTWGVFASAGVLELGGSANYRASVYDRDNYVRTTSYTGSLAYFVTETLAFELAYTDGISRDVSKGILAASTSTEIDDVSTFTALEVVWSPADPDALLRPFFKLGGGYLAKTRYLQVDGGARQLVSQRFGLVPSAGLGLALGVTSSLNLKVGVDAWTTPREKGSPSAVDYVGRAGLGWLL